MITSTSNEKVKYVRSLRRAEVRRQERSFIVEGVRLVEEALRAGLQPALVFANLDQMEKTARGRHLLARLQEFHPIAVSERVLEYAAETVTPQGVVAVLPMPAVEEEPGDLGPLALVLDGLRDPGNVGTILRSAEASGVKAVILTPDCADVFSPKVVRAAMGAHFRLKLLPERDWTNIKHLLKHRPIWVASAGQGVSYFQVDWTREAGLVVGSEAAGPSQEAQNAATGFVQIPMAGEAESLNAAIAASVIMFEALRQRMAGEGVKLD
ncbi:MAG: RNA methyltransferase [Chloroflexi bacterium]|nr:RNA methyltransferase [Chloroflexota bacterium]MDA8189211.1 RNA methyltransferase [Dehalococcoidales bacterium]